MKCKVSADLCHGLQILKHKWLKKVLMKPLSQDLRNYQGGNHGLKQEKILFEEDNIVQALADTTK